MEGAQNEITDEKLVDILQRGGYVEENDLKKAQSYAKTHKISAVDYLLNKELLTRDLLGQAIAEYFEVPYIDLNSNPPDKEQVLTIPESMAKSFRVVLFAVDDKQVTVTSDNPKQSAMPEQLNTIFAPKQVRLGYSLPEDIEVSFLHYRKKLETRFAKIIEDTPHAAPKLIDEVMADALNLRASDVHFEPQEKEVVVRFRVDDILQEAGRIPKRQYETIINRIKVMAHLRTDEHFAAQDGAIRYEAKNQETDLRVSIAPIIDGEKITIRILSQYVREFNLSNLGLSQSAQEEIDKISKLPFGMALVTGPTGSGKTTTLYSVVKKINNPSINITTIEDPVEYKIEGLNHIQVNPQTNLTFAKGLRSIVRQDPDVILVGEIRDEETANIAVNAALTGHLLFSTFHANDAATAVPRLLDMGIEPFLLASTLELVIAQRLVRRLDEKHRVSYTTTTAEISKQFPEARKFFPAGKITLYRGKEGAPNDGYSGRIAIFELIKVTPEMENMILKNPSSQQVWKLARQQGARAMFEDGVEKVKTGVTTLEEILRVSSPPPEQDSS